MLIIGASSHGEVVADVAIRTGLYKDLYFWDDNGTIKGMFSFSVLGNSED